jgi:two-component system response regulator DevR
MGSSGISDVACGDVTVYVYDANDLVRAGLRGLIDEAPGFLVVGSSGTEAQALADVIRLQPAVAVLGGSLGDDQALPLCRDIRASVGSVACVVLPTAIEPSFGPDEAAAAGAAAFLLKRLHGFRLVETIADIARGARPLAEGTLPAGSRW